MFVYEHYVNWSTLKHLRLGILLCVNVFYIDNYNLYRYVHDRCTPVRHSITYLSNSNELQIIYEYTIHFQVVFDLLHYTFDYRYY